MPLLATHASGREPERGDRRSSAAYVRKGVAVRSSVQPTTGVPGSSMSGGFDQGASLLSLPTRVLKRDKGDTFHAWMSSPIARLRPARARCPTFRYFSPDQPTRRQNSPPGICMPTSAAKKICWSGLSAPAATWTSCNCSRRITSRAGSARGSTISSCDSSTVPSGTAVSIAACIGLRPESARRRSRILETKRCSITCAKCNRLENRTPRRTPATSSSVAWL